MGSGRRNDGQAGQALQYYILCMACGVCLGTNTTKLYAELCAQLLLTLSPLHRVQHCRVSLAVVFCFSLLSQTMCPTTSYSPQPPHSTMFNTGVIACRCFRFSLLSYCASSSAPWCSTLWSSRSSAFSAAAPTLCSAVCFLSSTSHCTNCARSLHSHWSIPTLRCLLLS